MTIYHEAIFLLQYLMEKHRETCKYICMVFIDIEKHMIWFLDMGLGRKHPGLTIYFPSSPLNQTHSKKFSFSFSLQSFPSTLFHLQTNTPLKETNINHPKGHDYAEWVRITRPISSYEDGSGNA